MLSEVSLELRIKSDVAGVVEKKIELRLVRSRSCQIMVIQRAAIGRYERGICYPIGILKQRRLGRQETPQRVAFFFVGSR